MKNSIIFSILCFFLQITYRFSIDTSQISIKSYAWTPVLTRLEGRKVKQSTPAIISTNMVVYELDMTFKHVQVDFNKLSVFSLVLVSIEKIHQTESVWPHFQTTRSSSKILCYASYFELFSQCVEMWSNTIFRVLYYMHLASLLSRIQILCCP